MALPLPKVVYDVGPGGGIVTSARGINALEKSALENQYYGQNIESEIANRNALTKGQEITNQYLPEKLKLANAFQELQNQYYAPNIKSEIRNRDALTSAVPSEILLRQAQANLAKQEAEKYNLFNKNPGLYGGEDAKTIAFLQMTGAIPKNFQSSSPGNQLTQIPNNMVPSNNQLNQSVGQSDQQQNGLNYNPNNNFDESRPFNTGNELVNAILNRRYARAAYERQMLQGYNWAHLPADAKNQLTAQGYGMGVEPSKMMSYINQGLSLKQIAEKEGLDPDNLPPPFYPPTEATKTRVQQVQQVGHELDYLSSAVTQFIKPYANTFAGYSGDRIYDMLSSDPDAQKRFGRYVGALSLQSGLANGRVLLEGGRSGVEAMKLIKDSSLAGIDQHSPIKMSKVAYEEAQKTIDNLLKRGADIRTSTGMNPFSEISRSKNKENKSESDNKAIKIVRDANGNLVRA